MAASEHTHLPKYRLIVNKVLGDINNGLLTTGDKLPSINEYSIEHDIARDTVEKAYKMLKEKGAIVAIKGKGFYIASNQVASELNIFLHLNKLSVHKKWIYDAFISALSLHAKVDLYIHHNDEQLFVAQLSAAIGHYTHYVIIPPYFSAIESVQKYLNKIPTQKLLLLDRLPQGWDKYSAVYQHFESDIFQALSQAVHLLQKYRKFTLVFPKTKGYAQEVMIGFTRFCSSIHMEFEIVSEIAINKVNHGKAFLLIEDEDLVTLLKICKDKHLKLGSDIGIVSYNDSPLKEILADGITVISTNFAQMGKSAAEMILSKKFAQIKNPFVLIIRNSV